MKFQLILIFIFGISLTSFSQKDTDCDIIKVNNSVFDQVFQLMYESIEADSILTIRHCATSNGCANTYGILCWKKDSRLHIKKMEKRNGKIKSADKVNKKMRLHLLSFSKKKFTIQIQK